MRLDEEKILVWLVIIGILIIGDVLLIQIADSNISDYNKELYIKQGKINNILLHRLESQSSMQRFELYEIVQPDISIPKGDMLSSLGLTGSEYDAINDQFQKGEITKKEYLTKMKELYSKRYDIQFILYNKEWSEVEGLYSKGTPWQGRKTIFIVAEVFLIVLSLLGYGYLYKKIKNRVKDKERK